MMPYAKLMMDILELLGNPVDIRQELHELPDGLDQV
jgi:hypothetical protein